MIRTYFDEMYDAGGQVRPHYREFARWLAETPDELLAQRRREADLLFHRAGITFTLYGDEQGTERENKPHVKRRQQPAAGENEFFNQALDHNNRLRRSGGPFCRRIPHQTSVSRCHPPKSRQGS